MSLGDVVRIDDQTVLVLGQELDVAKDQPDVANALVHRVDDTLFVVDTGVTTRFRAQLRAAMDTVGPWADLVILNSHGHVDHVGNNDLGDELAFERGCRVRHYLPAPDVAQMVDPQAYWARSFERLDNVLALPAPPNLVARKVTSIFAPLRPFGHSSQTFEELPIEEIRIGSQRWTGWTFAHGAVRVMRSQGHCAGHVIVHLRDIGLLHLGDEANGACGIMRDADQVKMAATFDAAVAMISEGHVALVTDGHSFTIQTAAEAAQNLSALLQQGLDLHNRTLAAVDGADRLNLAAFLYTYQQGVVDIGIGGVNPNPMFTGFMATNSLRALGLLPVTAAVWRRPALTAKPTKPAPLRAASLVGAALSLLRWKVRGNDRRRSAAAKVAKNEPLRA